MYLCVAPRPSRTALTARSTYQIYVRALEAHSGKAKVSQVCLLKLDSFFFLGFVSASACPIVRLEADELSQSKRVLTLCTRIKSDRAQFLILVLTNHDVEFGLTIAAVPLLIAWLVFSAIAVRMESKTSTAVVWAGSIIGLAYFLFKCVASSHAMEDFTMKHAHRLVRLFQPSARELGYVVARKSLAVFSIISIVRSHTLYNTDSY